MLSKSNFTTRLFSTTGAAPNTVEPASCNCSCSCHNTNNDNMKKATRNTKNSLTPPRRWLERICGRPSLSSTSSPSSSTSSSHTLSPSTEERKQSLLRDYQQLHATVQEELAYAIESQGSIYYEGDLITAKRALAAYIDCYEELVQLTRGPELLSLHIEWEASRKDLYEKLKKLPVP
ncbi:hypothetical protein BDB00DRAFT_242508 [Zychaea mexicana]|uniref:uncharacterized protein n=1 Tax=Zychaea mexicana TaxID=64656 RepID=UPI0022FEF799|nr:uncharacterized protein BDB00DRAFT_242508 [Zychaea mexicana]KAI9495316.1 hypothetical protein BDB00DRAFT_242508 [Zychaea mexicana]